MNHKLKTVGGNFVSRAKSFFSKACFALAGALLLGALSTPAMAQEGSGNTGADAVITEISSLGGVITAVIAAVVAIVVIPWAAKMAIRAFKSLAGS